MRSGYESLLKNAAMKPLGTNVLSRPLDYNSELQPGHLYYVIPLQSVGSGLEELKQNSDSYPEIISTSSIDGSRVLRMKLRMRKEDVASFLISASNNFAEKFVPKEMPSSAMGQHSYKSGFGLASEWKPSLDTIPELNSLQAGN